MAAVPHRLVSGDVSDPEDVSRLMEGVKAALVVTDPPYNVAVRATLSSWPWTAEAV